jgi:hypothetical protein
MDVFEAVDSRIACRWFLDKPRYNPPPNPVKEADVRTAAYRARFDTDEYWELDALPPPVTAGLIRTEVEALIDPKAWAAAVRKEKLAKAKLAAAAKSMVLS